MSFIFNAISDFPVRLNKMHIVLQSSLFKNKKEIFSIMVFLQEIKIKTQTNWGKKIY